MKKVRISELITFEVIVDDKFDINNPDHCFCQIPRLDWNTEQHENLLSVLNESQQLLYLNDELSAPILTDFHTELKYFHHY